jgi:hypothetical protein
MPAVPDAWKDISFEQLRAEGAFLVDAKKLHGTITEIKILAEKGGNTRLKLPFTDWQVQMNKGIRVTDTSDGYLTLQSEPGGTIVIHQRNK